MPTSSRCVPLLHVALAGAALALAPAARVNGQTIPNDAQSTCVVAPPVFASWFESGAPSLNGAVKPADSLAFPDTPNCSFYQWSMQMFLWLTSPAPARYGGGARIFDSPVFFDVSPPDATGQRTFIPHTPGLIRAFQVRTAQVGRHGLPVVMDRKGRMFEVENPALGPKGKPLVLNRAGAKIEVGKVAIRNKKPVFLDAKGKPIAGVRAIIAKKPDLRRVVHKFMVDRIPIFVDSAGNVIVTEEGQADGGVLLAQNGSLVYYATMANDVYAYFLTGVKDNAITPGGKFPTTPSDLAKITTFATAHSKTFVDPNALAVELKTSWIETTNLPNASQYITMRATVPKYDTSNPNLWTPNGQKTVDLALVAMHVVGSTKGHPEMIWATFEHFGNTPNAAYAYNATAGPNPKTVPQSTAGTWLFAASGATGPFNVMRAQNPFGTDNIAPTSGHTIGPSDTMRMKPWGGASNASPNPLDATVAASNTEIISINNSVSGQMPGGDIRNNYFMMGSSWTIFGAAPTSNFGKPGNLGGNAVGTSQLANTTMETYQQVNTLFDANSNNCFTCHVTNTTSVSHVFGALKPLF